MNRILIKLYVPQLEKQYDIWIPINKTVYTVIKSCIEAINSINKIQLDKEYFPNVYNRENAIQYEFNKRIVDTDIRNGTELILI